MSTISEIADWCRENYSPDGVEVGSLGTRSLTLKIPADLPLTELCAELWNKFGATLELRQAAGSNTVTIIVWQGNSETCTREQHHDDSFAHRGNSWQSAVFGALLTTMAGCIVQYGVLPAFNGTNTSVYDALHAARSRFF
tara:strand:- start:41 stop:460 length:420 start_codon:yes stop_codon:yes gene_type:complete